MDFASYLEEIGEKTCRCGYTGKVYMFVSINGKEQCITCAGSRNAYLTGDAQLREKGKKGAEAAKRAKARRDKWASRGE